MYDWLLMVWFLFGGYYIVAVFRALVDFTAPPWRVILTVLPYIALGTSCFLFDYLCLVYRELPRFPRAIIDNSAHGTIAGLCWFIISGFQSRALAMTCALLASAIDADRFIVAGSLKLRDALSLGHRSFLHTTSIVIVAPFLHILCARNAGRSTPRLKSFPYVFIVAVVSHHLRDSHRRGLWFWPFGSTPPLPQWLYIICTMLLPYLVKTVQLSTTPAMGMGNGLNDLYW